MNSPAVLIATARIRSGCDPAFEAWKIRHDMVVGKFPGFVSSDILPPTRPESRQWTILLNFRTAADVGLWQQSTERAALLAEGAPLFEDGTLEEVVRAGDPGEKPGHNVTEVVFSKIRPGREDAYRQWSARIQAAQARYPGYRGMFLQPPEDPGGLWTTIIRFDTAPHLEAWMNAPERKSLLAESGEFIEHEHFTRLATSFPGWVPVDPTTGQGPPNWKTALLVLLGLFPVVMLELRFLSPVLAGWGLHASLATFIGNVISVAVTSFITMPLFVRWFGWWLFPQAASMAGVTGRGLSLLCLLFAIEVIALWKLLPW
ncbi:MAG: antibiotic biosynthesis monooxygenase [Verrucomicrobiae bacterium]|nr:antibiotic biosynthesis monooxygenase [Verrucomicrobiae bacterium]